MKSKLDMLAGTAAVTASVRPAAPRSGNTHCYELNGTLMRDVLVDATWITVHAALPHNARAA